MERMYSKHTSILSFLVFLLFIGNAKAQLSFINGQTLGGFNKCALGDFDGDNDVDIWTTTYYWINDAGVVSTKIWFNDGLGNFTSKDSITNCGGAPEFADFDGDGDLDAFIVRGDYSFGIPSEVWWNDGKGNFTDSGQRIGCRYSLDVALGDLDGDGDIDAFVCNHVLKDVVTQGGHQIWLNDGKGNFTNSGQDLANAYHLSVHLGDIDGDGDLDALTTANGNSTGANENEIWINDGKAKFTKRVLSSPYSTDLALADVDNDGDLDVLIVYVNFGGTTSNGAKLFLNNGKGNFTSGSQSFDKVEYYGIALGDFNNDGNLDALFGNGTPFGDLPNKTWIGDGKGNFTKTDLSFGDNDGVFIELADFNNDGKLDAIVGNKIWINTTLTSSSNIEEKLPLNQNVKVISNPATGQYSLSFGKTPIEQAIIQLYTISGSLMLSKAVYNAKSTTINLLGFQKGIYIIKVFADGELAETKFSIE